MKSKLTKIWGIGATLVLLASLMVVSPVAASTLLWGTETPPGITGNVIIPVQGIGANLAINDVAANGNTVYAATPAIYGGLYKSLDGGSTWSTCNTTTDYPTYFDVRAVAVAGDDANVLVMSGTKIAPTPGAPYDIVVYSADGGLSWSDLKNPVTNNTSIINDVDVSTGSTRYVAVASRTAGNAAEMYTIKLAMAEGWTANSGYAGFGAGSNMSAVKFSPNFPSDKIVAAVSVNGTTGATVGASFQVFRLEKGAESWNDSIPFYQGAGYGAGIIVRQGATALVRASIALPTTYLGTEQGTRVAFVGIAPTANVSGVTRVTDANVKAFTTWSGADVGQVCSIAYNTAKNSLLAGNVADSYALVCLDPTATDPKFERTTELKRPGGAGFVSVAWIGDSAVAGTAGNGAAFAKSNDGGLTYSDVSLIDDNVTDITDIGVSADGATLYIVSDDDADTSVFVRAPTYKRVLYLRGQTGYIVVVAPDDPKIVYVTRPGTTNVYVSKDAGELWKSVPCYKANAAGGILDMVVLGAGTAYVLDRDGVSKTEDYGATWQDKQPTGVVSYMITLAPGGDVLVGGTDGKIAFSKDGGKTFSATEKMVGDRAGDIIVVADTEYATANTSGYGIIYAYNNGFDRATATNAIYRGTLSKTMTYSARGMSLDASHTIVGLAAVSGDTGYSKCIIYALSSNGSLSTNTSYTFSKLWRALDPRGASASLCYWSGRSTSAEYALNAAGYPGALVPHNLKTSSGMKFWAVDNREGELTDIDSMTDPVAITSGAPVLTGPADKIKIPVNTLNGRAYTVTYTFDRYENVYNVGLQVQIATDSAFGGVLQDQTVTVSQKSNALTAGPNAQLIAEYMPGTTYYWRVRTNKVSSDEMFSPWSSVRSFTVDTLVPVTALTIEAPLPGATDVSLRPTFAWTAVTGAIAYEFQIAKDAAFTIPGWTLMGADAAPKTNAYQADHDLEYGTTYYWKVRNVTAWAKKPAPQVSGDWQTGIFTTMEAPVEVPKVFICPSDGLQFSTQQELAEHYAKYHAPQPPVPAIPTYMLWTIIAIGALLIIALIVLIVRTRRAS